MYCKHCGTQVVENSQFCQKCGQPTADGASIYHLASLGKRFGNNFLDGIFISLLNIIIVVVLSQLPKEYGNLSLFSILFSPLYYIFFESIWQRTPGKWVTNTKVVTQDGFQPSLGKIIGRSLIRLIPFEAFSFLFGAPIGWHDKWTKTLVVPHDYTPEQVQQIDPTRTPRSKAKTLIIIGAVGLVLIAIIGLIASVVLLSLNSARSKSRDASRIADVRQIAASLEVYYSDNDQYPQSLSQLVPKYLDTIPTAPVPVDGSCTAAQNSYAYGSTGKSFAIGFCLGSSSAGYQAGPHVLTNDGLDTLAPTTQSL